MDINPDKFGVNQQHCEVTEAVPVYTSWRNGRSCDVLELCRYIPAKGMAHNSLHQHLCAVVLYQQLLHILKTEIILSFKVCGAQAVFSLQLFYRVFEKHTPYVIKVSRPFPSANKKKKKIQLHQIHALFLHVKGGLVQVIWYLLNSKICKELIPSAPHTQAFGTQGLLTIGLHTKGTSNSHLHLSCPRRQVFGHRACLYLFS